MTKKLKIRFVKFNYALAMQVLEMSDNFSDSEHVKCYRNTTFYYNASGYTGEIYIQKDNLVSERYFGKNNQRDEYLEKVIKWISEEQFPATGKLEIGKECEVSDGGKDWFVRFFAGKSAKQLGEPRYLAFWDKNLGCLMRYKYVRPLGSFVRPKIDGDVYTWEMEVADER